MNWGENINKDFEINSDLEFYCYLKMKLPDGYIIVAEPSPNYYSEWDYHYKIFKGNDLWKEYTGNYKKIAKGALVREAKSLLNEIGVN